MPAEPRGSAHVATEATDTLLCRIEDVTYTDIQASLSMLIHGLADPAMLYRHFGIALREPLDEP